MDCCCRRVDGGNNRGLVKESMAGQRSQKASPYKQMVRACAPC